MFNWVCTYKILGVVLERGSSLSHRVLVYHGKLSATRIGAFLYLAQLPTVPYCNGIITFCNSTYCQIESHTSVGPWYILLGVVMDAKGWQGTFNLSCCPATPMYDALSYVRCRHRFCNCVWPGVRMLFVKTVHTILVWSLAVRVTDTCR